MIRISSILNYRHRYRYRYMNNNSNNSNNSDKKTTFLLGSLLTLMVSSSFIRKYINNN